MAEETSVFGLGARGPQTQKEDKLLLELCARVRRSGLDDADLQRLLEATSAYARLKAAAAARRRRWRVQHRALANEARRQRDLRARRRAEKDAHA